MTGVVNRSAATVATNAKLPKLKLMTYYGKILKWNEFCDCFESTIHNNNNVSKVDKVNYLKSQLIGEAKGVLGEMANTEQNYDSAVQIPRERFSKKTTDCKCTFYGSI